jgi:hypothetical protein
VLQQRWCQSRRLFHESMSIFPVCISVTRMSRRRCTIVPNMASMLTYSTVEEVVSMTKTHLPHDSPTCQANCDVFESARSS